MEGDNLSPWQKPRGKIIHVISKDEEYHFVAEVSIDSGQGQVFLVQ